MAEDAADPGLRPLLAEALEARRVVVRRPPRTRALGEDLHRVGSQLDRAVDRLVDPARGGDVRADQHSQASSRFASSATSAFCVRVSGTISSTWAAPLQIPATSAVDEHRGRDVPVLSDHGLTQLVRQDAAAVGEREQDVVPLRQEADRRGRVRRREWRARRVVERLAVLVAVCRQAVEGRLEVADAEAGPRGDVGLRSRPECAQVAAHELGACGSYLDSLWLCVWLVRGRGSGRPGRRLARVEEVCVPAHRVHHPAPVGLLQIRMRAAQVRENFLVADSVVAHEGAHPVERCHGAVEMQRPEPCVHVLERGVEDGVIARRDEVQRPPHDRRLEDLAALHCAFERLAPEALEARPEAEVRRRGPLRLQADEPLHRA